MGIAEKYFTKMIQVGLVYKDIDPIVKNMTKILGVEPHWGETPDNERSYRGKPGDFKCKMAFFDYGGIQLEFVQPIQGEHSIWQDFLDAGKEGIHHIQYSIDDQKGLEEAFAAEGISVYQQGQSVNFPGHVWSYFDTEEKLGFIIETINDREVLDSEK